MSPKSGLMYSFAALTAVSIIAQTEETAAASTHVVRAGDTLWSISRQHDVSVANLKAFNKLSSDRLAIGQTLELGSTVKPAATTPTSGSTTVTTADLNMRVAAGTWHKVLVTIPKGQALKPSQTIGAWTKVSYGGKIGWVHNGYLTNSSVKPTPLAPPSPPAKPAVPQEQSINQSYITTANLNVRQGPGVGYALVTNIPNGTTVNATKQSGTWVYVTYNGKSGYVSTGYLKQTTTAPSAPVTPNAGDGGAGNAAFDYVVNTPSLNVRASASTSSAVIGRVTAGQTLRVVQTSNGWHQIYIGNTTGFVAASYVKAVPKHTAENPPSNTQGAGLAAITVAQKYVGTPYVWASANPANGGFDCSGLIYYAFNQSGVSIPRTNVATYWSGSHFGPQLSKSFVPQAGDLVFFENTYTVGPSHMGIMINTDTFIHAGTYGLGYNTISKEPYWKSRVIGYKRP